MDNKSDQTSCCDSIDTKSGCCNVESVVTVDNKGQIYLSKEIRDKFNIEKGDKLIVVSMYKEGIPCCMNLIKADSFGGMVRSFLSPVMEEIIQGDNIQEVEKKSI